jgi:group II intron reverse transcriptase/maturase
MDGPGGGACIVVRARESRARGEGRQGTDGHAQTEEPPVDSGDQADEAWLLGIQRKLYQWSRNNPDERYGDLWNWVTDPRNLRCAWRRIARNKGSRTAGVDGKTVAGIRSTTGEKAFLERLRDDLRTGSYQPSPSRRKLIPKPGKPGKFRPLGIPTVGDRVVQGAVKNLLEPIFEATFWHVSYGFRPRRGCHGALEHIRMTMRPRAKAGDGRRHRTPYRWVIEGDIKGCFDHIDQHKLMERVRARIGDVKVNRLVGRFLNAGVLSDGFVLPTNEGTPQGGVISPLLANIALGLIEERYERWTHHRRKTQARRTCSPETAALRARMTDRKAGRAVFFPIRYADDCAPRRREEVRDVTSNSWQPCCTRDEGRPLGLGLQDQGPNHRKLRRSNGRGGERCGKRRDQSRQVCAGQTNASEPLLTCRKRRDVAKTRLQVLAWDEARRKPADWPSGDRHEDGVRPARGSCAERGNLSPRCEGRPPSGRPTRSRVPMRGEGTDGFVVPSRPGNAGGGKGPDTPAEEAGQPAMGGAGV